MFKPKGRPTAGQLSALLALLVLNAACGQQAPPSVLAFDDEHEDHEPEPVAVTVFTEKVQLFMEYPRLVPGHEARFLAHVTVLETGEPVRSGQLRIELSQEGGAVRVLEAAQPTRDGLFIPVGSFEAAGRFEARIVVQSEQAEETIPLDPIVVYPDLAAAFSAAEAESEPEPADLVPFLLEQQWKIGLLMRQVETRTLTQRLQVPGEIEAPQHAMAVVSSPLSGRLLPPPSGQLPRLGEQVEAGQVLALIEPPLDTADRAQWQANETDREALLIQLRMRELELQAKALEVQQDLQASEVQLRFAQESLARIEDLRSKELGTVDELAATRREVEAATQAIAGARALQAGLSQSEQQVVALREAIEPKEDAPHQPSPWLQPLVTPIAGEIVSANHVLGEHVEGLEEIYSVLDLSRVWVAAHVSEFDLADLGEAPGARLSFAAYPERSFDVLGEMQGRIIHIGQVVDPETRTIALHYEADNPAGLFRAGMFADVYLETKRALEAVALPEAAIVRQEGRPIAFVLVHGEAFQKRVLELGIHDGEYVEVLSGIEAGERVVTKGAYLVKLAAASPASFGEGHAH